MRGCRAPSIIVLTGPAAAGKNTIGQFYTTEYCERAAVIDVDLVRGMLRQPHVAPWDGSAGAYQHSLGVKHACLLAQSFVHEGCETIILDVVWGNLAQQYRAELADFPLYIIRLMPDWTEALRRLHARPHSITDAEAQWVYNSQVALQDFDYSLDNSLISAQEAAAWLKQLPRR